MSRLYQELRQMAQAHFRGHGADGSLQPTALVHEAYLRLAQRSESEIEDRTHFLAVAATAMRQIMIDHARARAAEKRGGGKRPVTLDDSSMPGREGGVDVLELNDALDRLARLDERRARVVELRLFGGLTIEETADVLGVSHMTVSTDWRLATSWLASEFNG